jgi:hypothetical protein
LRNRTDTDFSAAGALTIPYQKPVFVGAIFEAQKKAPMTKRRTKNIMPVTSAEWTAYMTGLASVNKRRDQQLEAILQELRAIRVQLTETANRQAQKDAETIQQLQAMIRER